MKKRKPILVLLKVCLLVVVSVFLVSAVSQSVKNYKLRKETLSFLKTFDGDVYLGYDGLFVLDKKKFTWVKVPSPPGFFAFRYGDADVSDEGFVFYSNHKDYRLEERLLGDPNGLIFLSDLSNVYPNARISRNLALAFTAPDYEDPNYNTKIFIYDPNTQVKKQQAAVRGYISGLCWSEGENTGLYWDLDSSIYYTAEDDLKATFQFEGACPRSLVNGDIVYWKFTENFHIYYRYLASEGKHVELYQKPSDIFLGYDCDPTGRYFVISEFKIPIRSLIPRNVITIYDTQSQKEYQLPIKKDAKTGVVFILPGSTLKSIRLRGN